MKKKSSFIAFLGVMLVALTMSSCSERINAGYEGIKVNLYGSGKGVDSVSLVSGRVWYNPITTEVYEYPTFVQTVDYPKFSINAKGGSAFEVDPTISLKIIDGQSAKVFKKYRKEELIEVINTTLYNYVKNAFRIELNKYTPEELVSKREEFEKAIERRGGVFNAATSRDYTHYYIKINSKYLDEALSLHSDMLLNVAILN